MTASRSKTIPAEAIEALQRGKKVEAIKLTRSATGMGLKESKIAVEALIESDVELQSAYQKNASTISGTRLIRLAVNLILLVFVIYLVLTFQ
jgi:ribosomal protein L7/L12